MLSDSVSRFSEICFIKSKNIVEDCLQHSLVVNIVSGKLPREQFEQFSNEDVLFLEKFSRGYCELALKSDDFETFSKLLWLAKSTAEERQQLASLFPKKTIGTSATNAYIQFLEANLHKSWSPFAAMSAMVPCMKLYAYIGQQKSKELSTWNVDSTAHPYRWWIEFYASEDFQQATKTAEELLDNCETEYLDEAHQTYIQAMYFEKQFFDNILFASKSHKKKED